MWLEEQNMRRVRPFNSTIKVLQPGLMHALTLWFLMVVKKHLAVVVVQHLIFFLPRSLVWAAWRPFSAERRCRCSPGRPAVGPQRDGPARSGLAAAGSFSGPGWAPCWLVCLYRCRLMEVGCGQLGFVWKQSLTPQSLQGCTTSWTTRCAKLMKSLRHLLTIYFAAVNHVMLAYM